ncbi:hypothetical protein [Novosphingobium sp. AP12]|uniref:hypothetical protein n=1 Tax=Novosphingobium sp. AP12 TaxID=1144305 RepID=UPI0012FC42E3|nr:hypothetical protein [Novosphingobium sp. AP12]
MPSTLTTVLGTAAILLFQAIVVGGSIYIICRFAKRRSAGGTQEPIRTDAEGGKVIPVLAAFAGVRGLPWWFALASNNANPSLVIFASGIRYRMIRRHERRFDDIARIEVRTVWKTVNIEMQFRGELLTFAVNVGTTAAAGAALALFPPAVDMSERAKAILSGSNAENPDRSVT